MAKKAPKKPLSKPAAAARPPAPKTGGAGPLRPKKPAPPPRRRPGRQSPKSRVSAKADASPKAPPADGAGAQAAPPAVEIAEKIRARPVAAPAEEGGAKAPAHLDREDRNEKIKELIKLAEDQGYLTYEDINETHSRERRSTPEELSPTWSCCGAWTSRSSSPPTSTSTARRPRRRQRSGQGGQARLLRRPDPHVPAPDGAGSAADARAGSRDLQADREGGDRACATLQPVRLCGGRCTWSWRNGWRTGEERFDRVVIDKFVDSRDKYMKVLPQAASRRCIAAHERLEQAVQRRRAGADCQAPRARKAARRSRSAAQSCAQAVRQAALQAEGHRDDGVGAEDDCTSEFRVHRSAASNGWRRCARARGATRRSPQEKRKQLATIETRVLHAGRGGARGAFDELRDAHAQGAEGRAPRWSRPTCGSSSASSRST